MLPPATATRAEGSGWPPPAPAPTPPGAEAHPDDGGRDGRRVDSRGRGVLASATLRPGDRGGRGADRLAGRRGRDADAGLRVPDPGRPQAEPGRRGLRL